MIDKSAFIFVKAIKKIDFNIVSRETI